MDNRHLRSIILKLQDRLSDNDRRRLHFFLGDDVPRRIRDDPTLGGTLCLMESLFDHDKIHEEDFSFLINALEEIQCLDAVKLLTEYMEQRRSNGIYKSIPNLSVIMPRLIDLVLENHEDDKFNVSIPLTDLENSAENSDMIINKQDDTIKTGRKQLLIRSLRTHKYSILLSSLFLFIQIGTIIGGCIWIIQIRTQNKKSNILSEQIKELNTTVVNNKETINELMKMKNIHHNELDKKFTEGKTCSCIKRCSDRGSQYGLCADGPGCICSEKPIMRDHNLHICSCQAWCQRRNYRDGICGDGYTCICSK